MVDRKITDDKLLENTATEHGFFNNQPQQAGQPSADDKLLEDVATEHGILPKRQLQQQEGGMLPFLKQAGQQVAAVPLGAAQEVTRLAGGTPAAGKFALAPGLGALLKAIPQAAPGTDIAQKIGGGLADVGAFTGISAAAAPLLGELGGSGFLAKLGRAAIKGFPAGSAISPGHRIGGGVAGSIAEPAAIGAGKILKGIPKLDVVSRSRLGQRVISGYDAIKKASSKLYDKAFEGTEGITPKLTDETQSNIDELRTTFPGARGTVPKAIDRYFGKIGADGKIIKQPNKTLKNLHLLRSDLGKEWRRLEIKRTSPTQLTTSEGEDQALLAESRDNINKSLENNFNRLSPDKKTQYGEAQEHFKNKVAPFSEKGHTAIMKAISPDRDITNKLFSEMGADSVKASKVRKVLGLSRSQLDVARLLRNKLITIPALALAGAGTAMGVRSKL